jgi:hypothetical protein
MQQAIKSAAKVIAKAVSQYTGSKFALGRAQEISARIHGFKDYASATDWFSRKGAFAAMLDVERTHAQGAQDCEYENEFILRTASGRTIHAPAYPEECSYVRVVDHAGNEIAYWTSAEWAESPEEVMGALLGTLKGGGRADCPLLNPLMADIPFVDSEVASVVTEALEPAYPASKINFDLLIAVRINSERFDFELHKSWTAVWAPIGSPERLPDEEIVIWLDAFEPGFVFKAELTAHDLRSLVPVERNETAFVLKREGRENFIQFTVDSM